MMLKISTEPSTHVASDAIRTRFARAMSEMYRQEVPQYDTLLKIVDEVNSNVLANDIALRDRMSFSGEIERIDQERHGAIRLGTATELALAARIFAVMGMEPVGYYDLSVAGIPVHSTAFRPVGDEALAANPFRVFTSLLRLDLIPDKDLREHAAAILAKRIIFSPRALELTELCEAEGGLDSVQADEFVAEVLETFRWTGRATVSAATYERLLAQHRLIADVVCFPGPHINHLTPRTLDIDAAQAMMPSYGIAAKETIEGPPRRRHPILLRQTSFKALVEAVNFADDGKHGQHTARFGEIEQRGMALTREGRNLYDFLLAHTRDGGAPGNSYSQRLGTVFEMFPDDLDVIRRRGLAFFRYRLVGPVDGSLRGLCLEALIEGGAVVAEPMVYEDFLPVSAAGIFQSNLGVDQQQNFSSNSSKIAFERDLGRSVLDETALYAAAEQRSIDMVLKTLEDAVSKAAS